MREIVQNELTYFEVGVTDASGKLRTGLVVDYEIHKCSDNSLLVSGTANEIGITGVYSFSYTFTDIEEYRLHWITPLTYDDGFELLNVITPAIIATDFWNMAEASVTAGMGLKVKTNLDATVATRATPADITTALTAFGVSTLTVSQIWDYLTATILTPGSIGKLLVDNIDTKLSDLPTLFWSKVIDGTYTADKVLKIMASILAGNTVIVDTGNNTAIVTFRNLDDTGDVVKANMNNSERITMTLTP